jgi:hypothetical protein
VLNSILSIKTIMIRINKEVTLLYISVIKFCLAIGHENISPLNIKIIDPVFHWIVIRFLIPCPSQ